MRKILLTFLLLMIIPIALATYTVTVNLQSPTDNSNLNATISDFCFNVTGEINTTAGPPYAQPYSTNVTQELITFYQDTSTSTTIHGQTQHGDVVSVYWVGNNSGGNCDLDTESPACGNFTQGGLITLNASFITANMSQGGIMHPTLNTSNLATYYINYSYGSRPFQNFWFDCYLFDNFTGELNSSNFPITNITGIIAHRSVATSYGEYVKNASYQPQACFRNIPVAEYDLNKTWGVFCRAVSNYSDYNRVNDTSNQRVLYNDQTAPVITVNTPPDGYYSSSSTLTINITVVDDNPSKCELWNNFNESRFLLNETRTYTNNTWFNFTPFTNAPDNSTGVVWKVICNDTEGFTTVAGNYTIYIDSTNTSISFGNDVTSLTNITYSYTGITIYWNTSEPTNGSFTYGPNVSTADGTATSSTTFDVTHSATMDELTEDTLYYLNITSCDAAGNCNSSHGHSVLFGFKVWPGWSWYPITESNMNLQNISYDSGASTISWFNETGQEFVSFINGSSSNSAVTLERGDAVALYSELGDVWRYRNDTNSTPVNISFSLVNGSNFIGILNATTFGELDYSMGNLTIGTGAGNSNISAMAYFNNTDNAWIGHFWNWSENNATTVPNSTVLWAAATQTHAWNRN